MNIHQKLTYYLSMVSVSVWTLFECVYSQFGYQTYAKDYITGIVIYIAAGAIFGFVLRSLKLKKPFALSYGAAVCILVPVIFEGYAEIILALICAVFGFALPTILYYAPRGYTNCMEQARADFASREFRPDGEYPLIIADSHLQAYICQIIKCDDLIVCYYIGHDPKGYDYKLLHLGDGSLRPLSKKDRCYYMKDIDSIEIDNSPSWRLGREFLVDVTVGNATFRYVPSVFWPDRDGSGAVLKMFWADMQERLEEYKKRK